jgi:hypothetical protein
MRGKQICMSKDLEVEYVEGEDGKEERAIEGSYRF